MARNNIIYAPTVNNFNTTLNGAISSSATTIALNSVTGLQNKAGILVIDRVDSSGNLTPSAEEWIYFNGVSGSSVTLPSAVDGRGVGGSTAQAHADGAIVEAVFDVTIWGGYTTLITAQHTDAGVHTAFTTDTLAASSLVSISSSLFVAGQVNFPSTASVNNAVIATANVGTQLIVPIGVSGASVSGAFANDTVQSNLLIGNASGSNYVGYGGWKSWSANTSLLSGGSISLAKYTQIGKTVAFKFKYVLAGAGVGTGPTFSLPIAPAELNNGIFTTWYDDTGTANYQGISSIVGTGVADLRVSKSDGTYITQNIITATVPHTWANTDVIWVYGTYEAA